MKVLVTCPPMLGMIEEFRSLFETRNVEVTAAKVVQTLTEEELCAVLPEHDGWIIGDDPATRRVFEAGRAGRLRAAVKWGIGVDNVDFTACRDLGIPITNCPNMFGGEVADIAMSYVLALARDTFVIDRAVRRGEWFKPRGISLGGKVMALVGFGDIGRNVARRALASDMCVIAYDPCFRPDPAMPSVEQARWPECVQEADFIVMTCSLNSANRHMLSTKEFALVKRGVRVVNVARGPLIDEVALVDAMSAGIVHSVGLDVFEVEPLPFDSPLRGCERTIFGSHNGSNTIDAVRRCSEQAIAMLLSYLVAPEA